MDDQDPRQVPIYTTSEVARWFGHGRKWWRERRPDGMTRWTFAAVATALGVPDTEPIPLPRAPVPMTMDLRYAWGLPRLVRGGIAWWIVAERLAVGASDAEIAADWDLPAEDVAALRAAYAKGVRP